MSWNLLEKPLTEETIGAWAKILDDVAKVAIIALPTVLYGNFSVLFKILNISVLLFIIYAILWLAKFTRNQKDRVILKEK